MSSFIIKKQKHFILLFYFEDDSFKIVVQYKMRMK